MATVFVLCFLAVLANTVQGQNKLLVGTGLPLDKAGSSFEVLDLAFSGNTCDKVAELPDKVRSSVGTTLTNGAALVCGGTDSDLTAPKRQCYQSRLSAEDWSAVETGLSVGRWGAASLNVINDNWWVSGGYYLSTSSDVVTLSSELPDITEGPRLPEGLYMHCASEMGPDKSVLIGGIGSQGGSGSRRTYIFDWSTNLWTEGPDLDVGRYDAACATIYDSQGGIWIIIAGGVGDPNGDGLSHYLDSSEMFNPIFGAWIEGPKLPVAITAASMVNYQDSLLFIGGWDGTRYLDTIYKFSLNSKELLWQETDFKLSQGRRNHVSMIVSDDFANCTS